MENDDCLLPNGVALPLILRSQVLYLFKKDEEKILKEDHADKTTHVRRNQWEGPFRQDIRLGRKDWTNELFQQCRIWEKKFNTERKYRKFENLSRDDNESVDKIMLGKKNLIYDSSELNEIMCQTTVSLKETQRNLYRGEESYFDETIGHGNIFRGWDTFVDSKLTPSSNIGASTTSSPPSSNMALHDGLGHACEANLMNCVDLLQNDRISVSLGDSTSVALNPKKKMPHDDRWFSSSSSISKTQKESFIASNKRQKSVNGSSSIKKNNNPSVSTYQKSIVPNSTTIAPDTSHSNGIATAACMTERSLQRSDDRHEVPMSASLLPAKKSCVQANLKFGREGDAAFNKMLQNSSANNIDQSKKVIDSCVMTNTIKDQYSIGEINLISHRNSSQTKKSHSTSQKKKNLQVSVNISKRKGNALMKSPNSAISNYQSSLFATGNTNADSISTDIDNGSSQATIVANIPNSSSSNTIISACGSLKNAEGGNDNNVTCGALLDSKKVPPCESSTRASIKNNLPSSHSSKEIKKKITKLHSQHSYTSTSSIDADVCEIARPKSNDSASLKKKKSRKRKTTV